MYRRHEKGLSPVQTLKRVAPTEETNVVFSTRLAMSAPRRAVREPLVFSGPPKVASQTKPVRVGSILIGGSQLTMIAGPGYVETPVQMAAVGASLQKLGIGIIRARAYRQETWSTEFQGLGPPGLRLLKATAERFGLAVVSEIVNISDLKEMLNHCDVIEVGPRNSHNYHWLRELGYIDTTVILHRGSLMTIQDFIGAIRQLEQGKRAKIVLAENGVRAFDPRLKNLLDISSIIHFRKETPYPVLVDCSAAASHTKYVEALAIAAISAGADGVMAEFHPSPKDAFVETTKALLPEELQAMIGRLLAMKSTLNALVHQRYS